MIKIVIVDDHPVVRSGLEAMFSVEDDMEVVATLSGGTEAVQFCDKAKRQKKLPDIVIADVHMPLGDGFEMLGALRNAHPSVKVLLLAGMPLKDEETRAREDGAVGYLPKSLDGERLIETIRGVMRKDAPFAAEAYSQETGVLTEKELTVLQYASEGKTREEIAIILNLSPETVKSHLRSIMRKLDTTNTASSVARGFALGLLRA